MTTAYILTQDGAHQIYKGDGSHLATVRMGTGPKWLKEKLGCEVIKVVEFEAMFKNVRDALSLIEEKTRLFPDPALLRHLDDIKSVLDQ